MDRKLFFSYIQNMQTNNPDMTGFQNSIRKNSWQKPRPIVEIHEFQFPRYTPRDPDEVRPEVRKAFIEDRIDSAAEKEYNDLIPQIEGPFDGFVHDPDGGGTFKASDGKVLYPIDAGTHLYGHIPSGLSDEETEEAHKRFIDALNKHHSYVTRMQAEADGRDWYADREMTHGGGNPPLHESSWSSAMRKARSGSETPMTVETNPKSPTDIKYVDDEGFRQLRERMRGLAGRHLRTMGKENHPSRELNDDERRHYKNILQEIEQGKHDEPLMDLIKDAMYDAPKGVTPADPVHGWQYVHGYAVSLIPQRISADIKYRVNSSILGGASRMIGMGQSRGRVASDRLKDNVYDAEDYRIRRGDYGP